jgi:hypothetical protein
VKRADAVDARGRGKQRQPSLLRALVRAQANTLVVTFWTLLIGYAANVALPVVLRSIVQEINDIAVASGDQVSDEAMAWSA